MILNERGVELNLNEAGVVLTWSLEDEPSGLEPQLVPQIEAFVASEADVILSYNFGHLSGMRRVPRRATKARQSLEAELHQRPMTLGTCYELLGLHPDTNIAWVDQDAPPRHVFSLGIEAVPALITVFNKEAHGWEAFKQKSSKPEIAERTRAAIVEKIQRLRKLLPPVAGVEPVDPVEPTEE